MPQKYDTNEPILILVRRGRNGRGFTVSPVEDIANPAVCSDSKDMGDVIEEFLNDEAQPRVNVNDLIASASADHASAGDNVKKSNRPADPEEEVAEDDEEYEDEEEEEGGIFTGVAGAEDPASQLLINVLSGAINQGRKMSSTRVRSRGRRKKRKKSS